MWLGKRRIDAEEGKYHHTPVKFIKTAERTTAIAFGDEEFPLRRIVQLVAPRG